MSKGLLAPLLQEKKKREKGLFFNEVGGIFAASIELQEELVTLSLPCNTREGFNFSRLITA